MSGITGKIIMVIGGSGSLGNKLIETYLANNVIFNYSRDENKHWLMELKYKSVNLKNIIGDIRDYEKIQQSILRVNPHIIIVAAALKHIDRCEYEINECLGTNITGLRNILQTVELNKATLSNLETICYVSTDKACSPVNVYGMSKAVCECMMIEKSHYMNNFKFVCVRYGNVLNSRGSIIPILNEKGVDANCSEFTLTHHAMTRFIMTLSDSVNLIEYAILQGNSGEIIIPKLNAMHIRDIIEIFSEKYNKPIKVTGIRSGEKLYESLINDTQSIRTIDDGTFYRIIPPYKSMQTSGVSYDYNSKQNVLDKKDLYDYLSKMNFI